MSDKIKCELCGAEVHAIQKHLLEAHDGECTLEEYRENFPDAPLFSELALRRIEERRKEKQDQGEEATEDELREVANKVALVEKDGSLKPVGNTGSEKVYLHELFGIKKSKSVLNSRNQGIPITKLDDNHEFQNMVPDKDPNYIFDINLLKTVLMGLETSEQRMMPIYLWGHAGTGKTTVVEQVCHYTNRPFRRVQHTANTEEAHIVGQMLANSQGTYFEPGDLALAMKHGWVYLADEYDYADPAILAVYQPVLEGKPLIIKEAPPEWRVVRPHKNFRFVATGNTNGSGDETGLYTGTQLGNAANYSRFAITEHVDYMDFEQEALVVHTQAKISLDDAKQLVEFAHDVRSEYKESKSGATIGPRELINAAMIGIRKGNFRAGLRLAFINRLNDTDRQVVEEVAQRIFGS